ncbi:MAG: lactate utilization protein C [Brevibacillus sp.]|nr:lactate utilization protein C [Brevibacillus sp.]
MTETHGQQAFLDRIARKLGRPRKSGVTPPVWNSPLRPDTERDVEDLIRQFTANLEALNTKVVQVTKSDFPAALSEVIERFAVKSAIYWHDPELVQLGLVQLLNNCQVQHAMCPHAEEGEGFRSVAAAADLGITTADLGVAETGTVVLFNGGQRGRVASLLPPHYLIVLHETRIVPSLAEVMTQIGRRAAEGLPACINLITGPSRTGDIEGDLAFGVHGPGQVQVILLRENPRNSQAASPV